MSVANFIAKSILSMFLFLSPPSVLSFIPHLFIYEKEKLKEGGKKGRKERREGSRLECKIVLAEEEERWASKQTNRKEEIKQGNEKIVSRS